MLIWVEKDLAILNYVFKLYFFYKLKFIFKF